MKGYLSTHAAARLLGVTLPTVVNWIGARRLKAHRTPGGHRRIAREDLAAFMVHLGMPLPPELDGAAAERRKALVLAGGGPAREGMARRLAGAGYAVEQASPGYAAGAALARFAPHVVVLAAPAADGGEPLRDLRGDREAAAIPVVAVARGAWADELLRAGCAAVAPLPLGAAGLEDAVARALQAAAAPRRPARRRRRPRD